MNSEFRQAISKPVVRLEDIASLRSHLEQKHPELSHYQRAEMMSAGIHKMLESNLTGLDQDIRAQIKRSLITNHLIHQQQSILKLDVLNGILSTDMHPDYLIAKTWNWYVLNTGHSVTLSDFISQASPYLPHRVRKTVVESGLVQNRYAEYLRRTEPSPEPEPEPVEKEPDPVLENEFPLEPAEEAVHNEIVSEDDGAENLPVVELQPVPLQKQRVKAYRFTTKGKGILAASLFLTLVIASAPKLSEAMLSRIDEGSYSNSQLKPPLNYTVAESPFDPLQTALDKPEYFRYQNVSIQNLEAYLERKNSKLLAEDYLEQLLSYSYEKDLNPLLLIAIIGQEQNYVPAQHKYADRMIQNPFNIYGSWETHQVGFTASMKEACYTINAALAGREPYKDPFVVINSRYAQDPHWYVGVKVIFRDLMALAGEEI